MEQHFPLIKACQGHDAEGVDVSPFQASCTQLATENCHQSRAICSDSNETAKRRQREKRRMRKRLRWFVDIREEAVRQYEIYLTKLFPKSVGKSSKATQGKERMEWMYKTL